VLASSVSGATFRPFFTFIEPQKSLPPASEKTAFVVSRDQIAAARWIRDHSQVTDLVMTNRQCSKPVAPNRCDTRHYVVSAFSERQVLVEAWAPALRGLELAPRGSESRNVNYWKPELLKLNNEFIAQPDAVKAQRLRQLGVRWVFVDHSRPYANTLEPWAELQFTSRDADVYRMR
jgi:hypothetical protein